MVTCAILKFIRKVWISGFYVKSIVGLLTAWFILSVTINILLIAPPVFFQRSKKLALEYQSPPKETQQIEITQPNIMQPNITHPEITHRPIIRRECPEKMCGNQSKTLTKK